MKKNNAHFIWSSDIYEQFGSEEGIKESWEEACDINDYPAEWVEDKEKMYDYAYDMVNEYLSDEWLNLSYQHDGHESAQYLVIGDIGRWDGRYDGGKIITGLRNAIEACMKGEDYSKIYQKGGYIYVDTGNHDGSSYFKIYKLSEEGERFYDKNAFLLSDREIHQRIVDNRKYRRTVNSFRDMYGW